MSETLISRVMRIISGNVEDGVDAIETHQAESVMREAIREIDRTIADVKAEARTANGNRLLARKRQEMTNAKFAELTEKAQIAISENRDDLAEAALSRQLDLEAQIPFLKKAEESCQKTSDELNGFMEALLGRKAEMGAELDTFIEMHKTPNFASLGTEAANENKLEMRADNAVEAFDRVLKSSNAAVGYTTSDRKTVQQLGELNSFIREKRISERLADLKSATQKASTESEQSARVHDLKR